MSLLLEIENKLKFILIKLIDLYKKLGGSNLFLVECNFQPSCSEYMKQSILKYGSYKGFKIGILRIRRCNDPDLIEKKLDPVP